NSPGNQSASLGLIMPDQKIKSVLELAKYNTGDTLFWVVLRPVGVAGVQIAEEDEWVASAHPKVIYERKLVKTWYYRNSKLPKLCALDFQYVVELLTSELVVERFEISTICRSSDTGEFYYAN